MNISRGSESDGSLACEKTHRLCLSLLLESYANGASILSYLYLLILGVVFIPAPVFASCWSVWTSAHVFSRVISCVVEPFTSYWVASVNVLSAFVVVTD